MDLFKCQEAIDSASTEIQEVEQGNGKQRATCVIVVDCSAIGFIDSCGLHALEHVADMCTDNKCVLYLASLRDTVLSVIEIQKTILEKIGLEHITPTIQDAIALANCRLRSQIISFDEESHL
ncbi:uncharacterized protein LOC142768743 [Rhipicephalus microplus]